ncbi:peptidase family C50-domain-containing protein [Chytridium lagenaria]|nr:peptidase family C50-domain-containing protein [Chytridium lagenaria]
MLGFAAEADYYFKRACTLAEDSESFIYKKIVLMLRAVFELRKCNELECEKHLREVNELQSLAVENNDLSWLGTMLVADLGQNFKSPITRTLLYQFAQHAEDNLPAASPFANLYVIALRECLLDQQGEGAIHVNQSDENVSDFLEVFALKHRVGNKVDAFIAVGRTLEAERLLKLQKSDDTKANAELVEKSLVRARLWFRKFKEFVQEALLGEFLTTIAVLFPVPPTNYSSRQMKSEKLRNRILQFEQNLKQAFDVVMSYGSRARAQEIGQYLVQIHAAWHFLRLRGPKGFLESNSLSSANILDQAKGTSLMRELRYSKMKSLSMISEFSNAPYVQGAADRTLTKSCIDMIPDDWICFSISLNSSCDLISITRLQKGRNPTILLLPLSRQALREGEARHLTFKEVQQEFEVIMKENRSTTDASEDADSPNHRAEWWKRRRNLDKKLGFLLHRIECAWIGGFKGLFLDDNFDSATCIPFLDGFRIACSQILSEVLGRSIQLDRETCRLILRLGPNPRPFELEDIIAYIVFVQMHPEARSSMSNMNIEAIEDDVLSEIRKFHRNVKEAKCLTDLLFTLESIPVMRGTSISRVPCMSFLFERLLKDEDRLDMSFADIDRSKVFYVLNPNGDLKGTQMEFEELFHSQEGWNGVVGVPPTADEFMNGLQKSDLFVYFGHGSGESFMKSNRLRNRHTCAATLLMGCSSGKQHLMGEFDSKGTPLNYLMGGCRALAVNLWDVTDRDIDRFSKTVMESCGIIDSEANTLKERKTWECRLKYLNGASPVLYGLPLRVKG